MIAVEIGGSWTKAVTKESGSVENRRHLDGGKHRRKRQPGKRRQSEGSSLKKEDVAAPP